MTTEKRRPLPPRVERALATANLDELDQELATWNPDQLEKLAIELFNVFHAARAQIRSEYLKERARTCDDHRVLLDACYRDVQAHGDALYVAVADVVMRALERAKQWGSIQ